MCLKCGSDAYGTGIPENTRVEKTKTNENKWAEFESEEYEIVDLGRPAVFILPIGNPNTRVHIRDLHDFMITHFDGYTCAELPSFGVWKDGAKLYYDRCKLYEVSFKGKEQIPEFIKKLTDLCVAMGERAIYFKAGQYSCLIKPKNK